MPIEYDIYQIENFIQRVFNYYNGKINICNPAILQIEWANLYSSSNGGITRNPNIVVIYPKIIERYSNNKRQALYIIIETIIHELHHIDQIIDYPRMCQDPEYAKYIEYAVEKETNIYIYNHRQEIIEQFGLDLSDIPNDAFTKMINTYTFGYGYCRRRYDDHLWVLLKEIGFNDFSFEYGFSFVRESILNNNGIIRIRINNNELLVQNKNQFASINEINRFFYENYYKYQYRVYSEFNYKIEIDEKYGNTIIYNIGINGKNVMFKKV